jgi:hypothetical protein
MRATCALPPPSVEFMGWPPSIGSPLPRAEEAIGLHYKLATYSLAKTHPAGSAKARGFELILGIRLEDIDYLANAIRRSVLVVGVSRIRTDHPFGTICVVDCPIQGIRS